MLDNKNLGMHKLSCLLYQKGTDQSIDSDIYMIEGPLDNSKSKINRNVITLKIK